MMFDHPKSPFLTSQEAADYLRLDVKTLNNMRWRGDRVPPKNEASK